MAKNLITGDLGEWREKLMLLGLVLLAGCAAVPAAVDDALRFNELQFIGSHNSCEPFPGCMCLVIPVVQ